MKQEGTWKLKGIFWPEYDNDCHPIVGTESVKFTAKVSRLIEGEDTFVLEIMREAGEANRFAELFQAIKSLYQ